MANEIELTASTSFIPDDAAGIAAIAELTRQGSGFSVLDIKTDGLGEGLPPVVPITVDAKGEKAIVGNLASQIEAYRQRPERRRGTAHVTTLQSFIGLVNYHSDEHSAIFAKTTLPDPALTAVIDYHQMAEKPAYTRQDVKPIADAAQTLVKFLPRHLQHRIVYKFPITEELTAWQKLDGELMGQGEFAAFIEEHAAELAAPTEDERQQFEPLFKERFASPNELIALSRALEVYVGAKVRNATRLSNGEREIVFTEEHLNAAGEKVDVPGIFMISVQPFLDSEFIRVPARLRYRLKGGISWGYQLYRLDDYLRQRVKADLDLAVKETGLPGYEGTPELG
ncbi:DUF2303 family protein [Rhodomicrobium lacus]|uniref:DUF2303 family protein n=1 Tax=Rhodomicrobium lacus TaxID=2498452 RepID=UPI000F8D4E48|nr:DUF2303 family protein [Rhodomicrobium lacus]